MPAHKLLLYPDDPDYRPATPGTLLARLQDIGLAGDEFDVQGETRYLAGEHFLHLITFLGCSPAIEFEPPSDPDAREPAAITGGFCHISLSLTGHHPAFRGGGDVPPPRCPSCRKPVSGWQQAVDTWRKAPASDAWSCMRCSYTGHIHELDFRRHGGFAHTFIDIWGIHPSEAVPVDALLASLADFSGTGWNYMYVKE
jgi:hypothetical protein